jgi:phage terminase small subunit
MRALIPRQERFCRRFVEYANATVAAKGAGYAPRYARNAGYRLLRQPRIVQRIAEIQVELAQDNCRDLDVLLGKLETVYRRAVDGHQFSVAARVVELQAKLGGFGDRLRTRGVAPERPLDPTAAKGKPRADKGSA